MCIGRCIQTHMHFFSIQKHTYLRQGQSNIYNIYTTVVEDLKRMMQTDIKCSTVGRCTHATQVNVCPHLALIHQA